MAARKVHRGLGTRLTIGFGGDVNLGGIIDQVLPDSVPDRDAETAASRARRDHPLLQRGMRTAEVWGDCIGGLQTEVTLVSLTSPLTTHAHRARKAMGPGCAPRRTHPLNAEVLTDANIDCVALANDHAMDFQEEGLDDTCEALTALGIAHAGSGSNLAVALRPAILKAMGRKIAVFSVAASGCGLLDAAGQDMWAARAQRSGIALVQLPDGSSDHREMLLELRDRVMAVRASASPALVIVSVCWGRENARTLDVQPAQRALARELIDVAGANVVHGHGTGHLQGVEVWHGCPIMYSCGTLVSDEALSVAPSDALREDVSCFCTLHLNGLNQLEWLQVQPLCSRILQTNGATGQAGRWARETLQRLCSDLGTTAVPAANGLRIPLIKRPAPLPQPAPPASRRDVAARAVRVAEPDESLFTLARKWLVGVRGSYSNLGASEAEASPINLRPL
jgi:poly-gamma-glutamate synthesis protein (capsule biosynthesis protein)